MNDYSHGPTIQGDENSSALVMEENARDAAEIEYEQRASMADTDKYTEEAEQFVIDALTGGGDELDLREALVRRFEKSCGSVGKLVPFPVDSRGMVYGTPEHLERLVRWTVKDVIDEYVRYRVNEFAQDER